MNLSDLSQILTQISTHEYYWNPKVEDSSCKIDGFMAKMGVAGLMLEPNPPNFENLHNL